MGQSWLMSDRRCMGGGLRKVAWARSHLRDDLLFSRAFGSTRRSIVEAKFDSERIMMAAMSLRGPSLVYNTTGECRVSKTENWATCAIRGAFKC